MKSKLEQLYEDQIIICKGLNLLKAYVYYNELGDLLTKAQQERLFKLNELEMGKLVVLERKLKNE